MKKITKKNHILLSFSKKLLILILPVVLVTSCASTNHSKKLITPTTSESFIKAKYLTELVYITRDKNLIRSYRKDYLNRNINKPQYKAINEWSAGKNRAIVIQAIDLLLDLTIEGA